MPKFKNKSEEIISQIMAFQGKPNGGIIKIILTDGSTVIGLFKEAKQEQGYVELSNGRRVSYKEIEE